MTEINNLIYTLTINYTNKSGLDTYISVEFRDDGLKIKTAKVENVCITEETINGRVLSGKFENLDGYCGYKYHYQNGEFLLNINPNISISTAISLIDNKKMEPDFMSAEFVLNSIMRNDYKIVSLNKGNLNIVKTVSAKNEKAEHCSVQESINLLKLDGEETFVEHYKKRVYKIDDDCVIEEAQTDVDSDIKSYLTELSTILNQNPQNYKQLIELKNQVKKTLLTIK
jgi:hypothetical protein